MSFSDLQGIKGAYKAEPRDVQKQEDKLFLLTVYIIVKLLLKIMQEITLQFGSPLKLCSPGEGTLVAFCGRILALGRWNLQMSWCKCPGVPRGQPPGMAADKCISGQKRLSRRSKDTLSLYFLLAKRCLHQKKYLFQCVGALDYKMFISIAKLNDRCFCYVTAAMFVTWRFHTKLYKFR